jgi:hypothetical protein
MSITPGRKPEYSSNRKNKLSSDARIIIALIKKQPQTKEDICQKELVHIKTFYRIASFLEKKDIIKRVDGMYALWYFNPLEKRIEDALITFTSDGVSQFVTLGGLASEIGKPWPEIASLTYEVAKRLGFTISGNGSKTIFLKTH